MSETEWLETTDVAAMLEFARGRMSDRKLRLFAAACCHQIWDLLIDERSRSAVTVAEAYADGLASREKLDQVAADAERAVEHVEGVYLTHGEVEEEYPLVVAAQAAVYVATGPWLPRAAELAAFAFGGHTDGLTQAAILRDIVGYPPRPRISETGWLTSDVVALAGGIYQDRAFDRLPILADALEDAGCGDPSVLAHCRDDAPHVRGCWVIDLLLGKK